MPKRNRDYDRGTTTAKVGPSDVGENNKNNKNSNNNNNDKSLKKQSDTWSEIDDLFSKKKQAKKQAVKEQQQRQQRQEEEEEVKNNSQTHHGGGGDGDGRKRPKKQQLDYSRKDVESVQENEWVDDGLGGKFNKDGYTGRVEGGVKVFKAHLFNRKNFGNTALCPFDCDCCFI